MTQLLKSQGFKCAYCKLYFMPYDQVELHHVLDEEKVRTSKMEFVHRHCHDAIHKS